MKERILIAVILSIALITFTTSAYSWTTAQRLTWTSDTSHMADIAIDSSNRIHVVWQDHTPGNWEIYYTNSADGGNTWLTAKRLTTTLANSGRPAIATDSANNIHVVFQDYTYGNGEILYIKSTNGSATWTSPKRLTFTPGASKWADIAVDHADNIHVVWHDDTYGGDWEVLYKKSTDGGATWSSSKRISLTGGTSYRPVIAIDSSNNLHVVWADASPGNREIFYSRSTDGGNTWIPSKRLTWTAGPSYDPAITIDSSDNIHVVWYDNTADGWDIYYKKSTDGGNTWTWAKKVTHSAGESYLGSIAADSLNNIHLVWWDNSAGSFNVYYKKSTDGGNTWTSGERITFWSNNKWPVIAIDSNDVKHVVWDANASDGNLEIYYKRD